MRAVAWLSDESSILSRGRKERCCEEKRLPPSACVPTCNSHMYCAAFNALKFWYAIYWENDESDKLQKTSWWFIYLKQVGLYSMNDKMRIVNWKNVRNLGLILGNTSVSAGKHSGKLQNQNTVDIFPYMGRDRNLEVLKYGTAMLTTQVQYSARKLHSIILVIDNFLCK